MKETRKQKIDRQRGHAADRAFDPIRAAIDSGALVITPLTHIVTTKKTITPKDTSIDSKPFPHRP